MTPPDIIAPTSTPVPDYNWSPDDPHTHDYLEKEIMKIISKLKFSSVCDVGCGNGALLKAIDKHGTFKLYGVEPDHNGSKLASAKCPRSTIFNCSIDDCIQIPEKSMDLVISTEVIEHLFSPASLLRLASKILAPSGHLILSTPYHGYLKNLALSITDSWDNHFTAEWHGGHIKFFSKKILYNLLKSNGFTPIEFRGAGRIPYLWKSMIVLAQICE